MHWLRRGTAIPQRLNASPEPKCDVLEVSDGPTVRPGHRGLLDVRDAVLGSDNVDRVYNMVVDRGGRGWTEFVQANQDPPGDDSQERKGWTSDVIKTAYDIKWCFSPIPMNSPEWSLTGMVVDEGYGELPADGA